MNFTKLTHPTEQHPDQETEWEQPPNNSPHAPSQTPEQVF